ncbi:BQ5605_C007g04697 [Microbotryum silenes-dioicae]|uniref:BQ5605_C007g04697 protein n=1 Tax=Microbotryum silenes-dioicae TaxID=796604 RepID=A0A2X0M7M4_9BASI|nr:BQ5605_C007g04697 [Microbotryum silenes-dioicae]
MTHREDDRRVVEDLRTEGEDLEPDAWSSECAGLIDDVDDDRERWALGDALRGDECPMRLLKRAGVGEAGGWTVVAPVLRPDPNVGEIRGAEVAEVARCLRVELEIAHVGGCRRSGTSESSSVKTNMLLSKVGGIE